MTDQPALFAATPPRDPVRCPRCGWRGEARELARIAAMRSKSRLLDLFCGGGGCTKGYQMAGFWVRGVDLKPQPRYVGEEFVQADALEYLAGLIQSGEIAEFDAIHASPPCQGYSISRNNGCHKDAPRMIDDTRNLLARSRLPFVIENVENAPLLDMPMFGIYVINLCGASFGLKTGQFDLARHRLFESNVVLSALPCTHQRGQTIGVYGNGTNAWHRRKFGRCVTVNEMREAMGIDWMARKELSQAIPPAYTKFIGEQLARHIRAAEGRDLAQTEDEWGACEACPACGEETIMEGR